MDINKANENRDLSLERLAGLAKIINAAKASQNAAVPLSPKRKDSGAFYSDSPALKTIKAAIPYIDKRYRRELGVMVKLIEIDSLLNGFKDTRTMSLEGGGDNMAMLKAIVPNLPQESRQMGETLVKLLEIKSIWELNKGV